MFRSLCLVLTVSTAAAWSSTRLSSFAGTALKASSTPSFTGGIVMYDHRGDPSDKNPINAWSVLAKTEEWIADTLTAATQPNGQNPYTRKEVSYVCETSGEQAMIVAGIFRRLKEAREVGQRHGEQEQDRALDAGSSYRPNTLRQTQVVVIPSNLALMESFSEFDNLIETINAARRHARDYVTGEHLNRMDGDDDDEESPWSVSVNCAHLHPDYGKKTSKQELEEMKAEEEAGEVDLNYQEFKEKRVQARRSPYPTIVVEVRASPPPDFGATPPASASQDEKKDEVNASDIQKLEALFGQSAHMNHPTKHLSEREEEDNFYARISNTIEELSPVSPMQMAQDYIAHNDPHVPPDASFTTSDAEEVDEAYEFVFTNFAMMAEMATGTPRYYVVLPHFCSASATSLEKFTTKVGEICDSLSELKGRVEIETFHPEHILPTRRAPIPILSFQWKNKD